MLVPNLKFCDEEGIESELEFHTKIKFEVM